MILFLSHEFKVKIYFDRDNNHKQQKTYNISHKGKVLVVNEIHKYKDFEIELKEIYDFLDLK